MEEVKGVPPNFAKIKSKFDLTGSNPVFAYGDKIYNPSGTPMPEHLKVHEAVHSEQQKEAGGPEIWWDQYMDDPAFRLAQEVPAYKAQYRFVRANSSRQVSRDFLRMIAKDLSSKMYGNIVNFEKAKELISNL